jgi:hypothetical protein
VAVKLASSRSVRRELRRAQIQPCFAFGEYAVHLRNRLKKRARVKTQEGYRELGLLKATTVHQEFRVLRRSLNVPVRKKLLPSNPCAGVEFPVSIRGLFRPHYVAWSEQHVIEFQEPEYLRNVVRIITETGLRVYKELTPMNLKTAIEASPGEHTPSAASVCSDNTCHQIGEVRRS